MRLEIRPFPTQRQRKEIKALPNVTGVESNAGQAWVVHSANPRNELELVHGIGQLGFSTKEYNPYWDLEARNLSRVKFMKKKSRLRAAKSRARMLARLQKAKG